MSDPEFWNKLMPEAQNRADPRILPAPKIPVVHENGVGTPGNGRVQQFLAGGDAAGNPRHLFASLDLQAVGGVVPEPARLENLIEGFVKFRKGHGHESCSSGYTGSA